MIIAHRGASNDAPENTLRALHYAWQLGADGVEFDVRLSADGHPVLVHDETMKRTARVEQRVDELTLAQLRSLDVGVWKGIEFRGERVPLLGEALGTTPDGKAVLVEIKTGIDSVPVIAEAIAATDWLERRIKLAVMSFDLQVALAARDAVEGARCYWVRGVPRDERTGAPRALAADVIETAVANQLDGVAADYSAVDARFVKAAADAEMDLIVWTVDDPDRIRTCAALGVAGIETNHPARALRLLGRL